MNASERDTLKQYVLWEIRIARARGDRELVEKIEERFKQWLPAHLDGSAGSQEGGAIAAICASLCEMAFQRAADLIRILRPILELQPARAIERITPQLAAMWEKSLSREDDIWERAGRVAMELTAAMGEAFNQSELCQLGCIWDLLREGKVVEAAAMHGSGVVSGKRSEVIGFRFHELRRLGLIRYAEVMSDTLTKLIEKGDIVAADEIIRVESSLLSEAGVDHQRLRCDAASSAAERDVLKIEAYLAKEEFEEADAHCRDKAQLLGAAVVDYHSLRRNAVSKHAERHLARIRELLAAGKVEDADALHSRKEALFRDASIDYRQVRAKALLERAAGIRRMLDEHLVAGNLKAAEAAWCEYDLYRQEEPSIPAADFQSLCSEAARVIASRLTERLEMALCRGDVEGADQQFQDYKADRAADPRFLPIEYGTMRERILKRIASERPRLDAQVRIRGLLRAFEFAKADDLQEGARAYGRNKYLHLKSAAIREYFAQTYGGLSLSEEQATALASLRRDNLLIQARAGSGKTRTLSCAAVLLMCKYGVEPGQLALLAFNKKAVVELRERLADVFKVDDRRGVRTFHSMAYQIARPMEDPLYDEDGDPKLSRFIAKTVEVAMEPEFRRRLYDCFRSELIQWEQIGAGLPPRSRLDLLRSLNWISLAGEPVKSFGEKVIADFLFQHDVKYWYERPVWWNDRFYRPDFTIKSAEHCLILEHWAVDPDATSEKLPEGWTCTAAQYRDNARAKRNFWSSPKQKGKASLIETNAAQLKGGRESFERILKDLLLSHGVILNRLPDEVLADRVCERHANRISRLFSQFVLRMRKAGWSIPDLKTRMHAESCLDSKVKLFLEMASAIFDKYEKRCQEQGCIDFDILLGRAATQIEGTRGECRLVRDRETRVGDLEWLLIDEFQDFSPQFDRMVQAIRRVQPRLRIVAVGDDWQAINAFAGSDLTYFKEFDDRFRPAGQRSLACNHRSSWAIVDAGNRLMSGHGEPATATSPDAGCVAVADVWQTRIGDNLGLGNDDDSKYRFPKQTGKPYDEKDILARYVKLIHETLGKRSLFGRTVALLSRTNDMHGAKIGDLLEKLRSVFTNEERGLIGNMRDKFHAGTIHSFKGKEADVVFLLEVCRGKFPLVHSDEVYFRIFGRSMDAVLDEERRLFYVALTRAKTHLFILTEHDRPSDYIFEVFPEEAKKLKLTRDGIRSGSVPEKVGRHI